MRVPEGMTEEEVTEIILKVARRVAPLFVFGYFSKEDLIQEAFILGIKALESYDASRPLENFLSVSIRNRIGNKKRDKYERLEKPCDKCPLYLLNEETNERFCGGFDDMMECKLYRGWFNRNSSKKALMSTVEGIDTEDRSYVDEDVMMEYKEIVHLIDGELPISFREDWIRLKNGIKIPHVRKHKLIKEIRSILGHENEE